MSVDRFLIDPSISNSNSNSNLTLASGGALRLVQQLPAGLPQAPSTATWLLLFGGD